MTVPDYHLRPMALDDYPDIMEALNRTGGTGLRDTGSFEGVSRYLARNPGMSFVAEVEAAVAGCVFSGHDGRRGYLYHLAVSPVFRRHGIGRSLVARAIAAIATEGVEKFHIDVFASNDEGLGFWQAIGWQERSELKRLSYAGSGNSNC